MVGNMGRDSTVSPPVCNCVGGVSMRSPPLGMGVRTAVDEDALGCGSLSGENKSAGRGCGTRVPSVGGRVVAGDVGVGACEGPSEGGERPSEGGERLSERGKRPTV
jgi:hypothetical protein